jgi:hypothetical protein
MARLGRRAFPLRGPLFGVDLSRADLGSKAVRDPKRPSSAHWVAGARNRSLIGAKGGEQFRSSPQHVTKPHAWA